jgi:hypothetical protein
MVKRSLLITFTKTSGTGNMNNDLNEYKELISMIQAAPQVSSPGQLTQNVMGRLGDIPEKPGIVWMLKQTLAKTGQMSIGRFNTEDSSAQTSGFYFLLAGLFFFIIGATLFNSLLFMPRLSGATALIMIQSVLVLLAAISLAAPGMMLSVNIPDADRYAKRAIMVFAVLIMANALLICETIKTKSGELMSLAFIAAGAVTGIILVISLKNRTRENNNTLTGELRNAQR